MSLYQLTLSSLRWLQIQSIDKRHCFSMSLEEKPPGNGGENSLERNDWRETGRMILTHPRCLHLFEFVLDSFILFLQRDQAVSKITSSLFIFFQTFGIDWIRWFIRSSFSRHGWCWLLVLYKTGMLNIRTRQSSALTFTQWFADCWTDHFDFFSDDRLFHSRFIFGVLLRIFDWFVNGRCFSRWCRRFVNARRCRCTITSLGLIILLKHFHHRCTFFFRI